MMPVVDYDAIIRRHKRMAIVMYKTMTKTPSLNVAEGVKNFQQAQREYFDKYCKRASTQIPANGTAMRAITILGVVFSGVFMGAVLAMLYSNNVTKHLNAKMAERIYIGAVTSEKASAEAIQSTIKKDQSRITD